MKKSIVTLLLLVLCGAAPPFAGADKVTYTYDDAGRLLRATYASGKTILYTYDAAGNLLSRVVTTGTGVPAVNAGGAVNGASFTTQVAAGSVTSVFGTGLAPANAFAASVPLPTTLGGSSLKLNTFSAPLFFVSPQQINFQVPWELAGQAQASITASLAGVASSPQSVGLAAFAPGIFTTTQSGSGQGAILIASSGEVAAPAGSIPGRAARPVMRREFLSIYCVGLGPVTNRPDSGAAAPSDPLATTTTAPTVTIGGVPGTVNFAGLAPGFVGLYQVNVQVPDGAPSGDAVQVAISIGGATSNTVTIAVQ